MQILEESDSHYCNGISGVHGVPMPPILSSQINLLQSLLPLELDVYLEPEEHLGLDADLNPQDLRDVGWAIVCRSENVKRYGRILANLIRYRAGICANSSSRQVPNRKMIFVYEEGESSIEFVLRHKGIIGSVVPSKIPYYLLIVGSPEEISFEFEQNLSLEYAVGRLDFATDREFEIYASNLISYDRNRRIESDTFFFSTRHQSDEATQLSSDLLVSPLSRAITEFKLTSVSTYIADQARKCDFVRGLYNRDKNKAMMVFTASHGILYGKDDVQQMQGQGALLCQNWKRRIGPIEQGEQFGATDAATLKLDFSGSIWFCFACYSAGTPTYDRFEVSNTKRIRLAERPFVASLPKSLLGRERGALAFIGHVDRAWASSFRLRKAESQTLPFERALTYLLRKKTVGSSLRDLKSKLSTLAMRLSALLAAQRMMDRIDPNELARTWVQKYDAEGYMVIGDPAARF